MKILHLSSRVCDSFRKEKEREISISLIWHFVVVTIMNVGYGFVELERARRQSWGKHKEGILGCGEN
jgi:hypothetical protein